MTLVFILAVPTPLAPESGRCVACGCTEERACEGGCAWVDEGRLLCSSCLGLAAEAQALRTAKPAVDPRAFLVEAGGRLTAELLRLEDAAEDADEAGDEESAAGLRGMQERLEKVRKLVERVLEHGGST